MREWQHICQAAQTQCLELLAPFLEAAESVTIPQAEAQTGLVVRDRPVKEPQDDLYLRLKGATRELMLASTMVGIASFLFPPLMPVAVGVLLWAPWRGWKEAQQAQLEQAKQELRKHLADVLHQVQHYFFHVDLSMGRLSRVDEYFAALERAMFEHVQAVVTRKSAEARAEIARLMDEARLDEQQRQTRSTQTKQQLAAWDDIGKALHTVVQQLQGFDRAVAAPATSGV
jgi:hypothetical protein